MLRVGVTGGIGSGKSTVARIFEVLDIPVYYADEAAKRLMKEDADLKQQIMQHFGAEAYLDGRLQRSWLAGQVFNDPEKLGVLNSLVHPATIRDAEKWMALQTAPYSIKEAALIFESSGAKSLDYVIGVFAPKALRIQRTMKRDGITREEVIKRMKNQIDEDIKMKLCDFVICNDEQQAVLPQVLEIHKKLIRLAAGSV